MTKFRRIAIPVLAVSGALVLGGGTALLAGQAAGHAAHAGRAPAVTDMKYRSCPNETPAPSPAPAPCPSSTPKRLT
jgi:hypothetical protein